jgi:hypothetical protein
MDGQRFDALTRTVSAAVSRRSTVKGLAGGGLTAVLSLLGGRGMAAEVGTDGLCRAPTQKCRKNKQCCSARCRQGVCQCQKKGALCQFPVFCCSGKCKNGKCR